MPEALLYLWEIFIELFKFDPETLKAIPITYQEIYAWGQLMHCQLTRQEIDVIKKLERLANAR